MQKEKPSSVWNEEKSVINEGEPQKVVREEEGELSIEKTENILDNAKNYLLADIKKTNLRIEEINMLYFVLQNFKNRKIFRNDNSSEDDRESKNEKEKESAKKSNLSVSEPEIELNLCKMEDDMNSKGIFKLTVKKSDFSKLRQTSPNDNFHKKVMKWNSSWTSDIMQKRAKKEDCSSSSHEIKNEEDNKELELADNVKHDKKYFLVHSGRNHCKLCSFKGKLIVHHYKSSHPESEVFVSRINPDITEILIEDALQNREEYNENHPKLQKMTCNFKCPFCLIIIKGTPNMYCNHICSHTGEYYFHCKHCPYWTYNYTDIHSHMKQIHYKIYRAGYKILYPKYIPKASKFVFGYICSECNFIQLKQTTVEKHVMVYHPGTPEIHKVNLGMLLHVDENRTNEIYSNYSNPNNLSSQIKEAKVLAPKAKQLVLMSRDYSNCSLVLTDVPMTDIEKQNRKCPNVMVNMTKPALLNTLYNCNLKELVPPYNCEDDGFPICPFKTLYFDEYLKHFKAIHQINRFSSFSSEHELTELVMEGWLAKEVGPFQCRYCKKATVTYKEMGKHQTLFHAQEECSFYYRKFVPNDTVTAPEQVNLEVPSFINHVIHLPDQVHLCDFKLTEGLLSSTSAELIERNSKALLPQQLPWEPETDPDQQKMLFDEPEKFSLPADFLNELDPLFLEEEPPKDVGAYNSDVPVIKLKYEALEFQCKWEGCFQKNQSQTALVNHIEDDHIKLQSNYEFSCFWTNCPRRLRPYMRMRQLLTHMRSHTGEKPYKCLFPGCDKAYPQLGNLKTHQRSHKGESLYSCQFPNCFMSFSDNFMRLKHQKAHVKAKTYFCRVTGCGKKYNYSTYFDFWKHMKNHTVDEQLDHKQKKLKQLESVKNNQK